jgi:hypothetical protein
MLLRAVVIAYENQGLSISDQDEGGGVACLPCTMLGSGLAGKQGDLKAFSGGNTGGHKHKASDK